MVSKESYWLSEEGIQLRLEGLAEDLSWRYYNGALHMSYEEAGFKKLVWITNIQFPIGIHRKGSTCKICFSRNGRTYRIGQFLPRMPVHNHCNCWWDVEVKA